MGSVVDKKVYIEFFGLPGCGKSTVSHMLAEKMRAERIRVIEPSYDIDHRNGLYRAAVKLSVLSLFCAAHPVVVRKIAVVCKRNNNRGIVLIKQTANVVMKMFVYYRSDSGASAVIWDQGLLQSVISVALQGSERTESINRDLTQLLKNDVLIIPVFLKTTKKAAGVRRKNRNTQFSRIDKEQEPDKIIQMENRFEECCRDLCDIYPNAVQIENDCDLNEIDIDKIAEMIKSHCVAMRQG